MSQSSRMWSLLPLGLLGLAILAPALIASGHWGLGFILHNTFALVCHQQPERSFWIFGTPVAVCARCLGIYLGAAIGLLLRTPRPPSMRLLIAAAVINLLDVVTEFAGLHGNWSGPRFALGLMLGAAGAMMVALAMDRTNSPDSACRLKAAEGHSQAA